jgi:hypothetical protein
MESPRQIVKTSAVVYLVAHVWASAMLIYTLTTADVLAVKRFTYIVAGLGPMALICTTLEALRAWRGQPRNEVADTSIPALAIMGICVICYLFL